MLIDLLESSKAIGLCPMGTLKRSLHFERDTIVEDHCLMQ